jgi:hypothetical protein
MKTPWYHHRAIALLLFGIWQKDDIGSVSHTFSAISPDGKKCIYASEEAWLNVLTFADESVSGFELPCNSISALD